MGMNVAGGSSLKSEINVTPLVDVVLVLLIIFMVVIPILQMGYPVNTPPVNKQDFVIPPSADQLIVRMDRDGRTYLNKEEVPLQHFGARLKQVTANRGKKMVFFAADGELSLRPGRRLHGRRAQQRRREPRHRLRRHQARRHLGRVVRNPGPPPPAGRSVSTGVWPLL